jgi:hypothetical protein
VRAHTGNLLGISKIIFLIFGEASKWRCSSTRCFIIIAANEMDFDASAIGLLLKFEWKQLQSIQILCGSNGILQNPLN